MYDLGTIQPEIDYRGWGISAVQERDGTWIAYVARRGDMIPAVTGVTSFIQKSQSYLAKFLAITDLEIQIDEFEIESRTSQGGSYCDVASVERIEPTRLLAYDPIADTDAAANIHEPGELGSIDDFEECGTLWHDVPSAPTQSAPSGGAVTAVEEIRSVDKEGKIADSDLPPVVDKRLSIRKRSLLGGVVVHGAGQYSFRCSIRDFSDSGARIEFSTGQIFPANLYLINIGAGTGHEAKVTWVQDSEAGLTFVNSFQLNNISDPKLGYLNRAWIDHLPRYSSGLESS